MLTALLFAVAWMPLINARADWRAGRNAEAIGTAERWSELHLWPSEYQQLLAAAFLTAGNEAAARPHLAAIGRVWFPAIGKPEVARHLFARGRYADFLAYDNASRERSDDDEVLLYRAAAQAATTQSEAAALTFARINAANVDKQKYERLRAEINERKRGLPSPYVLDRANGAIALYHPATNTVIAVDPDFAPIIDRDAGALTIGAHVDQLGPNATIETTLDPFVQKAALAALGDFRGSLVAIDPQTNEILAIANSGTKFDRALESEYEAGSVVKVLTGGGSRVSTENGTIAINTGQIVDNVKRKLDAKGIDIFDSVTVPAGSQQFVLFQSDELEQAQGLVDLLQTLAWVLPFVALA